MGKNRKKPNNSKVTSGRGARTNPSKDSVTGLAIIFDDIGLIESDKVYSKDSPVGRLMTSYRGSGDTYGSFDNEFEFNNRYFVITSTYTVPSTGQSTVNRSAAQGEFTYKGSRLTSARLDYGAQIWSSGPKGRYGGIEAQNGLRIEFPNSFASFLGLNTTGTQTVTYDEYPSQSGQMEIRGSLEPFKAFGEGKFFYDGWENNPFNSNLI